ncbi:small integral membrane protein 26-like [Gouania willdenowi]|uniref:small integral membrane protein 26-like n=1 Tax=Gouania willdenowi TaxID=441366 RepID=UPI0010564B2C|nr:small integral membrane protein 26 [Gouania willdenowi]
MQVKDVLKWRTRLSAVYALGVWTMIVSYGIFKYTGCLEDTSGKEKQAVKEEEENPYQVTFNTAHSRNIIIYKKDFVPYTTRIYNFVKSFNGDASAAKDSGNESSDP